MPDFQFAIGDLAAQLGASVTGKALSEEIGLTIQLAENGLFVYTPENGAAFIKTRPTHVGAVDEVDLAEPVGVRVQDVRALLPRANGQNLKRRSLHAISLLVIHWDGGAPISDGYDPVEYYKNEARYHINKDWGGGARGHGLMYHRKVARDGTIYATRDPEDVVWACSGANDFSLNVCVDATEGQPPTAAQLRSVEWLADQLWHESPELPNLWQGRIAGHGELTRYGNATSCPGPDLLDLVNRLKA